MRLSDPAAAALAGRLRPALRDALHRLAPVRVELRAAVDAFAARHGEAVVVPRPLAVRGRSPSWKQARAHARKAAALEARLAAHPVAVAIEWGAAPHAGPDDEDLAHATAASLAARIAQLAEIERAAASVPTGTKDSDSRRPHLHRVGLAVWRPCTAATGRGWGRSLARAFAAARAANPRLFAESRYDWELEAEDAALDAVLEAVVQEIAGRATMQPTCNRRLSPRSRRPSVNTLANAACYRCGRSPHAGGQGDPW